MNKLIVIVAVLNFLAFIYLLPYYIIFTEALKKKAVMIESSFLKNFEFQNKFTFSEVLLLANNSKIKNIYSSLQKEVGNLQITDRNKHVFKKYEKLLQEEIEPWLESVKKVYGERPKIDFHFGNTETENKSIVADAQRERVIKLGLEVEKEGLKYKIVAPILIKGEVYGSIASGEHFNKLVRTYLEKNYQTKHFAIILKKNLEKDLDTYIKEGKAKIVDDFILYDRSENVTDALLQQLLKKAYKNKIFDHNNLIYIKIPLKSYNGEDLGFMLLSLDHLDQITLIFYKISFINVIFAFIVLLRMKPSSNEKQ